MKLRSSYICQQCGYNTPQWYGKCPSCGEWNSLVETVQEEHRTQNSMTNKTGSGAKPQKLSLVKHIEKNRLKSGFSEFDRVMGGGIVPGSVTLLAGDPGIGKSTLILHILGKIGGLYVSGEESAEQVKLRAKRLGIEGENIEILAETNVENIISNLGALGHLVIIDSIQTLTSSDLVGMAGSVGQIRRSAELLVEVAKSKGIPIIIIGHVTKEGAIAGPKVLEHMVDTVLYLEGERFASARILRTLKNRFGAIEEVGIFEMEEKGLKEIDNPSKLFLQDRVVNVPGSVVTVILEGTRPMLVEIQALVVPTQLAIPRRVASGTDYNRLQLLVAILQKRLNLPLGGFDIFVNVSGGMTIDEPSSDLAIVTAIISSFKNKAVDPKFAVFGEVGLLGEIRRVNQEDRRVKEAKRLGFGTVVSPGSVRTIRQISDKIG
jgi:DNA repair protein RadA/Sms